MTIERENGSLLLLWNVKRDHYWWNESCLTKWKTTQDIGNEVETVENYWRGILRWPTVAVWRLGKLIQATNYINFIQIFANSKDCSWPQWYWHLILSYVEISIHCEQNHFRFLTNFQKDGCRPQWSWHLLLPCEIQRTSPFTSWGNEWVKLPMMILIFFYLVGDFIHILCKGQRRRQRRGAPLAKQQNRPSPKA